MAKGKYLLLGTIILFSCTAIRASADTLTFDFNTLSNGASNATIENFMQDELPAGTTVTVVGAIASDDYTADGYVTGPVTKYNSNYSVNSYTLADLTGGTFIMNNNLAGASQPSSEIKLVFTGLTVSSLSFAFEIFPNMYCTKLNNTYCGGAGEPDRPDLDVKANGSEVTTFEGVTPGHSAAGQAGVFPTDYIHSPVSGHGTKERSPQLLGTSDLLDVPEGTTELEFVDWYPEIAINDLVIDFTPDPAPSVPEPASLALFGSAIFAGWGAMRLRKTR